MSTNKNRHLTGLKIFLVLLLLTLWLTTPRFFNCGESDKSEQLEWDIIALKTTLDVFKQDTGRYPTSEEGLKTLLSQNNKNIPGYHNEGYIKNLYKDPWGRDYYYKNKHGAIDIWSYGSDGTEGGEEDNKDVHLIDVPL